jgi:4-hydroxy-3-polyprenylbenzoate decarboxylase
MESKMILIIGITGATGAIYGVRLLETLSTMKDIETHLVISRAGEKTIGYETGRKIAAVRQLANYSYDVDDIFAPISSGSFYRDGMIVAPCTIKTMSALANSYSDNLLTRAGDVTLKEGKKLVLAVRETPLHLGHLRNMARLAEMGAVILPPVPAFYHKPKTIQDIVDHTVGKLLDVFEIKHELYKKWEGYKEGRQL